MRTRLATALLLVGFAGPAASEGAGGAGPAAGEPPPEVQGNRKIAQAFDLVYQIKTATDAGAPKASYGSSFVVGEDGLLATNFHVVSTAMHEPEKYNLYLVDGAATLPAEVVAFDVANDLALLKVERQFPKVVRLAKVLPSPGTKIFSIGLPEDLNKSVIEGNFNGLTEQGPYEKLQMSIPLNPGMSGGPTLNEAGELLGVNVSIRIDSQNLAFGVPKHKLEALLATKRANFSEAGSLPAFDEEVRRQLDQIQLELAALFRQEPRGQVTLGDWQAEKPEGGVKCWRDTSSGAKDLSLQTTETCYLPGTSPVRQDHDTGTFRIRYETVASSKLNGWQFLSLLNEELLSSNFYMAEYVEKLTTKFSCGQMDLINASKTPLRVHYCVSAYVRYSEIYNMEIEAVTLGRDQSAMIVSASLLGFSSRSLMEISRRLIDGIRRVEP